MHSRRARADHGCQSHHSVPFAVSERRNMKILAIDDNPDTLTVLKAVVSKGLPGAILLTAMDGPQRLELAQAEDPDVILLDIDIPGLDGYAVCRKLKGDPRRQTIPVLFLTVLNTGRESRIEAMEAGAERFISKLFDEVEMIAQIRAMAKIKAATFMQRNENEMRVIVDRPGFR